MGDDRHDSMRTLGDLLDIAADRHPDDPAITDGRTHLSWAEYRDRAAALAGALADAGVRTGDRVAIHLPKSVDSFVAVHATLRLGAIVVPVDWFAPAAYARLVLDDAEVAAVVSTIDRARWSELVGDPASASLLDPAATGRAVEPVDVDEHADAYIVYTSGSTGRPKGVVHTHRSALAYARRAVDTYGLSSSDQLANVAALHFDQSTFELYAAPLAGASVVVLPDALLRFPASVAELIERERVTVWYSVPHAIIELVTRGAIDARDLGALRWVLFGGESFPASALADAMRRLPSARFSNVYGPAEVNQCTFHHFDAPPEPDAEIPIGRMWSGAEGLLLDEHDRPAPVGDAARLLVSADTMMDRYWRRPDLTAAAIMTTTSEEGTSDEGTGEEGDRRWYRTGDLVRQRPDGTLVFLGRIDHQVKVRGHRIELEAVESVLAEDAAVRSCAVVVDPASGDRLVALVAPPPDETTRDALRARLRERLPAAAVPREIVGVAALPRGGTGKIDRSAAAALLDDLAHGDPPEGPTVEGLR